jgi:NitT/TauT family transport system ATP-binding protein
VGLASIEIQNVSKTMGSLRNVLENVTMTISEYQFVCVLGPSGCGKSTLLNMVAGFDAPSGGKILHRGNTVTRPEPTRAMIFQNVQGSLFSWLNVQQNVEFGPRMRGIGARERRDIASAYISLVGLADFADSFPHQLSGGQKQRVQIARALANEPEVLLMDEPFGALDAQTRSSLQAELERIWRETRKTVLFITHDIAESIRLADRIIVPSKGPGAHVIADLPVDVPRPRAEGSSAFANIYRDVESLLHSPISEAVH